MDASRLLRSARLDAGLSIRELARLAGTSHSAVAAYESGAKEPRVSTLDRLLRAAGRGVEPRLVGRVADPDRGRELEEVLVLAEQFPARHRATIAYPPFPRAAR